MKNGSELCYQKAISAKSVMTPEEVGAWKHHPLTEALLETLKGDYMGIHEAWADGFFTGESADETSQKNAKALGQIQAIEAMIEWIENPLEEEE